MVLRIDLILSLSKDARSGSHTPRDAKQGMVTQDILTSSFPRKRESRAIATSLALDPRFRGGDNFKHENSKQILRLGSS